MTADKVQGRIAAYRAETFVPFTHAEAADLSALVATVERYEKALREIAEGKGPYKRDRLEWAESVIENLTGIARDALGGSPTHE